MVVSYRFCRLTLKDYVTSPLTLSGFSFCANRFVPFSLEIDVNIAVFHSIVTNSINLGEDSNILSYVYLSIRMQSISFCVS